MRKFLIIGAVFVVMSFMGVINVFATSIGSQSIDVTVGEVDIVSDDEEQGIIVPDTGLFGLESHSASVVVTVIAVVPMIATIVWLSRHIYHKHKRKTH